MASERIKKCIVYGSAQVHLRKTKKIFLQRFDSMALEDDCIWLCCCMIGNAVGGCWYSLQWSDLVGRLQQGHLRIQSATHSFTFRLVGVPRRDCLDFSHSSVILSPSWLQGDTEVMDQRAVQSMPHGMLLDSSSMLSNILFAARWWYRQRRQVEVCGSLWEAAQLLWCRLWKSNECWWVYESSELRGEVPAWICLELRTLKKCGSYAVIGQFVSC